MTVVEQKINYISTLVLDELKNIDNNIYTLPIGISARHIHLSEKDITSVFGNGYNLSVFKNLSQPGQFAANDTVEIIGPKGKITNVRILGPARENTQVEVSVSDCRKLGIEPMVRASGDIKNSPSIKIKGPAGEIEIPYGVIVAERHIHFSEYDAKWFNVKDGDLVKVKILSLKSGVLDNVIVRVNRAYRLELHIDTDDANAFLINTQTKAILEK